MCLLLTEDATRHILTEDLVVYKILLRSLETGTLYSPFRSVRYEIGKVFKSYLALPTNQGMTVRQPNGYAEYQVGLGRVSEGLHGYLTLEGAQKSFLMTERRKKSHYWERAIIFKARVPAGSAIYYGVFEDNEPSFAANQLIIDEPLECHWKGNLIVHGHYPSNSI